MSSNVLAYYLGVGLAADRPTGSDFGSEEIGFYYASDTGALSQWSGSAWISVSGSSGGSASESANFTTSGTVRDYYLDTASTAITVTLNATPAADEEARIWDSTGHAGTHAISFDGNGNNIAGAATLSSFIAVNYGSATLKFNGTQWLAR
jgi:hypothetical protein